MFTNDIRLQQLELGHDYDINNQTNNYRILVYYQIKKTEKIDYLSGKAIIKCKEKQIKYQSGVVKFVPYSLNVIKQ